MALADSMLKYGMKKIKMSQASVLGDRISKIGDLGMEAGAALSKVGKATESNRQEYQTIQAGKKEVGIDDEGSFLERTGLKSSLSSDKSFDVKIDEGGVNPSKVSYDTRGLKQIGTLSSTYSSDHLIKKYGQGWKEKYGIRSNIKTPFEYSENKLKTFDPIGKTAIDSTMKSYASQAKMLELGDGPTAPINPNTGKRFMTVEEGDKWDIKNKEHLQKVRDSAIETEINKEYNKAREHRSKERLEKEKFLSSLSSPSGDSIDDEFFPKHKTKETYTDEPKGKDNNPVSSLTPTKTNQTDPGRSIEDQLIDKFSKNDETALSETSSDISLKYENMGKEKGLNFASSSIDKETGKTIYNLYNEEGTDLGAIFSMKDGKMIKEDKEFFNNMKYFKQLAFPKELYRDG